MSSLAGDVDPLAGLGWELERSEQRLAGRLIAELAPAARRCCARSPALCARRATEPPRSVAASSCARRCAAHPIGGLAPLHERFLDAVRATLEREIAATALRARPMRQCTRTASARDDGIDSRAPSARSGRAGIASSSRRGPLDCADLHRAGQSLDALRPIVDPDFGRSIVELGFIKNLRIDDARVAFDIELTTPACPVKAEFEKAARERVGALPGVTEVAVTMTSNTRGRAPRARQPQGDVLPGVANVIAVASGKGGVGKSTVAVNLALRSRERRARRPARRRRLRPVAAAAARRQRRARRRARRRSCRTRATA